MKKVSLLLRLQRGVLNLYHNKKGILHRFNDLYNFDYSNGKDTGFITFGFLL